MFGGGAGLETLQFKETTQRDAGRDQERMSLV